MPPSSLRPHRRHRVSITPPDCRQTSTHSICSGNTHAQTLILAFPLTFHHISFVVAVIVAVRGPVVDVEALDRSVVVTRGTILHGGELRKKKKKKITFRLQQSSLAIIIQKRGNFPATNGRACYQQMYTTWKQDGDCTVCLESSGHNESDWG